MYAMRYGALPVTRAVGGVAHTVEDAGRASISHDPGAGFTFGETTPDGLERCLMRATAWYHDSEAWKHLLRSAMLRDFGWERSARRYLELYATLLRRTYPGLAAPFEYMDADALRETRTGMAR